MAEAMLSHRLAHLGVPARVTSAGLLEDGMHPPYEALAVMAEWGLDTSYHRSRRMTEAMLEEADVVVGLARRHVREAVHLVPGAWPKSFTLKELVRRAEWVGPRERGQSFDEWLGKVHAGRSRADLLGASAASPDDDVPDPIGLPQPAYAKARDEIAGLVDRLVELAWADAFEAA